MLPTSIASPGVVLPRWGAVPFDDLVLRGDEIHVWAATLDAASSGEECLEHILRPDEGEI